MTKKVLALIVFVIFISFVTVIQIETQVSASDGFVSDIVQVDEITHTIEIADSGLVIINDTIRFSARNGGVLQNLSLGFPYQLGAKLEHIHAYNTLNPPERFEVKWNTGLGGRVGFYGVKVVFPAPGLDLSIGDEYKLTVIFSFSHLIAPETEAAFNVTFPMYPSLPQNASSCDVQVILPQGTNYADSWLESENIAFNVTNREFHQILNHTTAPLTSFQNIVAWLVFNSTDSFPIFEIKELEREITLDQGRNIHVLDIYHVINRGQNVSEINIRLPAGTHEAVRARDELGDLSMNSDSLPNVLVQFRTPLKTNEGMKLTLMYDLVWQDYVTQSSWQGYTFNMTFLEHHYSWMESISVVVVLPEGAEVQPTDSEELSGITKTAFQEIASVTFRNVTPFNDLRLTLTYEYLIFWASFRPTLWMGVLVAIACAIRLVWPARAQAPLTVPQAPIPPEDLNKFVDIYERKRQALEELDSMEGRLRRGKIPRRRYKVRKKMLEGQLSTLSRDLSSLRDRIRAAGSKYRNIMRQIEVAETMLEGVETDIRRVEARYKRGEISKGAHSRLVEEYHRRRENARTTIDGAILRLKEEIR